VQACLEAAQMFTFECTPDEREARVKVRDGKRFCGTKILFGNYSSQKSDLVTNFLNKIGKVFRRVEQKKGPILIMGQ